MLEPLDRCRRDATLFQFTGKRLRDFNESGHVPARIDRQPDFAKLVSPLQTRHYPDFGALPSAGDGEGALHPLASAHHVIPQIVPGHLREHLLSGCLSGWASTATRTSCPTCSIAATP